MWKLVLATTVGLALAGGVLFGVANASNKQPNQGTYCNGTSTKNHPKGDKLVTKITDTYSMTVTYDEVMDWFCLGYGFGEIDMAYRLSVLSGVSVDEIFQMREDGMGWGQIKQELGYSGNSGKPHPSQSQNQSQSSSQGQGSTKEKGKPDNPGKAKGKEKGKGKP